MEAFTEGSLLAFLATVPDPRSRHGRRHPRAYAPLFQGLRTTFSCVFEEGFSRELSSGSLINTNCNALSFRQYTIEKLRICDPKAWICPERQGFPATPDSLL